MLQPVVITLPADAADLRDEIEEGLAAYAELRPVPRRSFDMSQVKLVLDVIGVGTGILANSAAVATFLLLLKDRARQSGQPSGVRIGRQAGPDVALEDADEALLRELLGVDE